MPSARRSGSWSRPLVRLHRHGNTWLVERSGVIYELTPWSLLLTPSSWSRSSPTEGASRAPTTTGTSEPRAQPAQAKPCHRQALKSQLKRESYRPVSFGGRPGISSATRTWGSRSGQQGESTPERPSFQPCKILHSSNGSVVGPRLRQPPPREGSSPRPDRRASRTKRCGRARVRNRRDAQSPRHVHRTAWTQHPVVRRPRATHLQCAGAGTDAQRERIQEPLDGRRRFSAPGTQRGIRSADQPFPTRPDRAALRYFKGIRCRRGSIAMG